MEHTKKLLEVFWVHSEIILKISDVLKNPTRPGIYSRVLDKLGTETGFKDTTLDYWRKEIELKFKKRIENRARKLNRKNRKYL